MSGEALLWGAAVAGALVLGATAGAFLPNRERVATTAAIFGGGMLLGALAFDIVPEAEKHAGTSMTAAGLAVGALAFWASTGSSRAARGGPSCGGRSRRA